MILDTFFDWIIGGIGWLFGLLPRVNILDGFEPQASSLLEVISISNCFVPWGTIVFGLTCWILLANADMIYQIVKWIYSKIPGVN